VKFLAHWIFLTCLVFSTLSFAVLGGKETTIEQDRKTLASGQFKSSITARYTLYELVNPGITLREYVNPKTGIVFGLGWEGYRHIDMEKFLGSYFEEYQTAAKANPRRPGLRYRIIKSENLVVEFAGRPMNLKGRAYHTKLIPQGVELDEIK